MSANVYKRLNVSDTFVVPYTANKSWDINSSSFADDKIVVNIGVNKSGSAFNPNTEYLTNGAYDRLVYDQVNLAYYPAFLPRFVDTSSRQNTLLNDGTLTTSSYWRGAVELGNSATVKSFPTASNALIYVLNIPRNLASEKILPTTFEVYFSSASIEAKIYDDGNYNLFYSGSSISSSLGIVSQGSQVGNIFYEQNVAILTNVPNNIRLRGWRGSGAYCEPASPSPTPTKTPTVTPSISVSNSPGASITPTVTPTVTPSITVSNSPGAASVTPTVTPSISVSSSPGASVTPTVTPSITVSPTITPSITITPTVSVTPSITPTSYGVGFGRSTTGYATTNLACSGTVTGVVYQPPSYGATPTAGAQLYTDSALTTTWTPPSTTGYYLFQYGGSNKWAVVVTTGGAISSVDSCIPPSPSVTPSETPAVTPSQTPSSSPPVVTSLLGFVSLIDSSSACAGGEYGSVRIDVTGTTICDANEIVYLPTSVWSDMVNNQIFYVSDRILGVDYTRTFNRIGSTNEAIPYDSCNSCPIPSPSVTPTVTPTITPTVTPSISISATPSVTPSVSPFPQYGVYIRLTAPTTEADCTSGGLGYYSLTMDTYDFCTATTMTGNVTGLTTNVHYVCYNGYWRQGFHSGTNNYLNGFNSCTSCIPPSPSVTPSNSVPASPSLTPSPTPSVIPPSPSPSTVPGYDFYYSDRYDCADPCSLDATNIVVAFPAGSSVVNNKWYSWSGTTHSYKITGTTTDPMTSVPILYDTDGPYNDCTTACAGGGG